MMTNEMKAEVREWAMREPQGVLRLAIAGLAREDLVFLLSNISSRSVGVCCGKKSHLYADGEARFSVEALCDPELPPANELIQEKPNTTNERFALWHGRFAVMHQRTRGLYQLALENATEDDVREAAKDVCADKGIQR